MINADNCYVLNNIKFILQSQRSFQCNGICLLLRFHMNINFNIHPFEIQPKYVTLGAFILQPNIEKLSKLAVAEKL